MLYCDDVYCNHNVLDEEMGRQERFFYPLEQIIGRANLCTIFVSFISIC